MLQVGLFVFAAVIVLVPLGALFVGSVLSAPPGAPGSAFTLDNLAEVYGGLFSGGWMQDVVLNTVIVAVPSSVLACLIGTMAAWAVARTDIPGRRAFQILLLLPMFYSPLIDVIGWSVIADGRSGLINIFWREISGQTTPLVNVFSMAGIVMVMTNFFIPYVFIMNLPLFQGMDPTLEESAATSGANMWQTLRRVTLPILMPSILASLVLVFTLAMEQFTIPGFLGSQMNFDTLAYFIYGKMNFAPTDPNLGAAAGTILLLLAVVSLWLYRLTLRKAGRFVTISGKGHKTEPMALGALRLPIFGLLLLVVFISTLLPLAAVLFRALLTIRVTFLRDVQFGFDNFAQILNAPSFEVAFKNSMILGVGSAVLCAALGWAVAYQLLKRRSSTMVATDYLIALPIAIPGTVFGIGMLWGYVFTPVYLTIWILLIAFVTRYAVYAVRMFTNGMLQLDKSLEEAGATAGAGPRAVLSRITLPLLKPVLASVILLIFLTIMRELSTSIILYGFDTVTMPILTWSRLEDGFYGEASAISLVQLAIVFVCVLIVQRVFGAELKTGTR